MPWAAALPAPVLDWLARTVTDVEFAQGDVLITQGHSDRDCYMLVNGEVEVVINGQVVGRSGPGEPEGEMALLYKRPRGATVTALEHVRALKLAADDFDALTAKDPDAAQSWADAVIAHLSRRFGWALPVWKPN